MSRTLPVLICASGLAACAPQPTAPIPVDVAEAQCVRQALGGDSNSAVTIGVGTGTGGIGWGGWGWDDGWGWGGGTGVAVSTTLPQTPGNPEGAYNACVLRKSGFMPDTPLSERPEVKG
jgi:hypothetical protein